MWGLLLAASAVGAAACDKLPLLAPAGSTITLSTNASVVQANGTAEIRATVIEGAGTPVQNGTTVTFSTNLGTLSPPEARTVNGTATVQFIPNGQSGTATIHATSGNATPPTTQATGLALTVGGAAATKVQVTSNPSSLPAGGGSSTITASVTDTNGNPLSGIPVSFSTDVGNLSNPVVTTSSTGQAVTTLTTTRDATVTATAGATAVTGTATVKVGTLPEISIAVTSGSSLVQGGAVGFTVTVTPGTSTDPFASVVVNYGDGQSSPNLGSGSTSVQHTYNSAGTFTVTATGTTASGSTKQNAIQIVIQPMIVSLAVSKAGLVATFTATVSPAGTAIANYFWDFGDGTSANTTSNTSPPHTYVAGTYTARVTVTSASGATASASTPVTLP